VRRAAGCHADGAACGSSEAIVERVIDGDTIVVTAASRSATCWSTLRRSRTATTTASAPAPRSSTPISCAGKRVELDYDVVCDDRFGRTLAYVRVGGVDVSRLLLERGYACVLHIRPTATHARTSSQRSRRWRSASVEGCGARATRSVPVTPGLDRLATRLAKHCRMGREPTKLAALAYGQAALAAPGCRGW